MSSNLRVLSVGSLFLTHTLSLDQHPAPSSVSRAHSVSTTRAGSASTVACILAQFPTAQPFLFAALGGNDEARLIHRRMEKEGVSLRFCKFWPSATIPSAWVLQAAHPQSTSIIHHNPLPDITHEEFISILGPILAPENYPSVITPSANRHPTPLITTHPRGNAPPPSIPNSVGSPASIPTQRLRTSLDSPAPFEWIHFEGRSIKTTLSNITGLDGLARERKWRSHCVFSIDIGRKAKQGVEVLIPHADVIFLTKSYALSLSPHYASSPRSFLLSMAANAPRHALLIVHWGSEGNAVLSIPTQEYFQSSQWVDNLPKVTTTANTNTNPLTESNIRDTTSALSVRSGSDYYAGGRGTPSSAEFTARRNSSCFSSAQNSDLESETDSPSVYDEPRAAIKQPQVDQGVLDEVGAQDAFVAGMIFALSRRILPGPGSVYAAGESAAGRTSIEHDRAGRWRLDECLRFATELSGRKARRSGWDGLSTEMETSGWKLNVSF